jgi:hypothetical protein
MSQALGSTPASGEREGKKGGGRKRRRQGGRGKGRERERRRERFLSFKLFCSLELSVISNILGIYFWWYQGFELRALCC